MLGTCGLTNNYTRPVYIVSFGPSIFQAEPICDYDHNINNSSIYNLHNLLLLCRVWDRETGAAINILTGEADEERKRAARALRDVGTTKDNLVVTCSTNDVLKVVVPSAKAQVGTVFIAPPCAANTFTVCVSGAAKRLAFFNESNIFMVYELCL